MINSREYTYTVRDVVSQLQESISSMSAEEKYNTLSHCIDALMALQRDYLPLDWYRQKYPMLTFTDDVNEKIVKSSNPRFNRCQAIRYRDLLTADGLTNFRVLYRGGGYVQWLDETPYSQALDELMISWGDQYKITRRDADDAYQFIGRALMDEASATIMADTVKERYPWMLVIVYFGPPQPPNNVPANRVVRR